MKAFCSSQPWKRRAGSIPAKPPARGSRPPAPRSAPSLLLPLPPPAGSAGAEPSSPLPQQARHHQGHNQGHVLGTPVTLRGRRPPRGWVRLWLGGVAGGCAPQHGGISPTPHQNPPGGGRGRSPDCRRGPGAAAGSQPARSISDAVHYNPIRLFMQTIRFYVSVKSLNNLNQSKTPDIIAGGGCGLLGGGQDTLPGW